MDASAPRIDCTGTTPPVGYPLFPPRRQPELPVQPLGPVHRAGRDRRGGPTGPPRANTYPEWIVGFLQLAEQARGADRAFAAAYYDRAAEFFMTADDPRRGAARARFLQTIRAIHDVVPEHIPFESGAIPALRPTPTPADRHPTRRVRRIRQLRRGVVPDACPDGRRRSPHRGVRRPRPRWLTRRPRVADDRLSGSYQWPPSLTTTAFEDVTAVGISLGGGLAIRAAAFEPRITRAVAYDILDDEFEIISGQLGGGQALLLRALMAMRARGIVNAVAGRAVSRRPVAQWGLQQGMHITGTTTPYDFLQSSIKVSTKHISQRVTADVLLLAGADDHFVPLKTLGRQAAALTHARSLTTCTFTAREQASNHCQTGNIGEALRIINNWSGLTATPHRQPIDTPTRSAAGERIDQPNPPTT